MRPVFEKRAVLFEQRRQVFAAIGLVACEQDLVMGALDRLDAVDLHEAEPFDQLQQALLGQRLVRRFAEALPRHEHATRIAIREVNRHGGMIGIYSHSWQQRR